jgi:RimJ/RimL family protein N-acetyltransferase
MNGPRSVPKKHPLSKSLKKEIENGTPETVIVVETPRLVLRKLKEDDLDELCSLYADEDVRRYFPTGILSRAQRRKSSTGI